VVPVFLGFEMALVLTSLTQHSVRTRFPFVSSRRRLELSDGFPPWRALCVSDGCSIGARDPQVFLKLYAFLLRRGRFGSIRPQASS